MRSAAAITAVVIAALLGAGPAASGEVRIHAPDIAAGGPIVLTGLAPETLERISRTERTNPRGSSWSAWFSLRVPDAEQPVAARYAIAGSGIELAPRFPLQPGLVYEARFAPRSLGDWLGGGAGAGELNTAAVVERFELPSAVPEPSTVVTAIHPSGPTVPANLLKFYLYFSAPMTRGHAYRHVRIVDHRGEEVELAFVELEQELWDPEGRRLTLLFDPGRLKAGLVPRREVGAALAGGDDYALVVDREWKDASGAPLREGFRHPFGVTPRDDAQPDPSTWRWAPPNAGTRDPLVIDLGESLDEGLLRHAIWVVTLAGGEARPVEGTVEIAEGERVWRFVPQTPWPAEPHELRVDPLLEDLAGNSVARPFEVDLTAATGGADGAPRVWSRSFVPEG